MPCGVERLARAEQLAGQCGLQPGSGGAGRVVEQQHRWSAGRAERQVVLPQLWQGLATGEAEIAVDEIAFAEIGPVGHVTGISERWMSCKAGRVPPGITS